MKMEGNDIKVELPPIDVLLKAYKKMGVFCPSDYAVTQGVMCISKEHERDVRCFVWSSSSICYVTFDNTRLNGVFYVSDYCDVSWCDPSHRAQAMCLTMRFTDTLRKNAVNQGDDFYLYGGAMLSVEESIKREQLEENQKTGRYYIYDKRNAEDYDKEFEEGRYEEYSYNGKNVICVTARPYDADSHFSTTGKRCQQGEEVVLERKPLMWVKVTDNNGEDWLVSPPIVGNIRWLDREKVLPRLYEEIKPRENEPGYQNTEKVLTTTVLQACLSKATAETVAYGNAVKTKG